jgi:hypothetical protein
MGRGYLGNVPRKNVPRMVSGLIRRVISLEVPEGAQAGDTWHRFVS